MYESFHNGVAEVVYEIEDFLEDLPILAEKLKPENIVPVLGRYFDGVWGVPAGGTVLAVCPHYRLDLPLLLAPTKHSVIAGDVIDTGKTMMHYIEQKIFCVSLFYNPKSICKPDIWVREKENDIWVRFALWEGEKEHPEISANYKSPWEKVEEHV